MRVLCGDVGGTNTRFGVCELHGRRVETIVEESYPSRGWSTLEGALRDFLAVHEPPFERACFAVAGPVREGRVHVTNLPWTVEAARLALLLQLPSVALINDLEANAYGLETLQRDDVAVLHPGRQQPGNLALVAAGTGLGEAGLVWENGRYRVVASEGGHADFAPGDELELELWRFLRRKHGHVSWERVLSGPGLVDVYTFLQGRARGGEPLGLADEMRSGDPAAVVTRWALGGRCEICSAAVDLFAGIYGSEAGNLALRWLALGGVYIGGGIAPRLLPVLERGSFARAFCAKGRMSELVADVPVRVVLDDRTALRGAALHAANL